MQRLITGEVENETINLAYGKGSSLPRLAELISQAVDRPADVHIEHTLVGEVTHYVADIGKARQLLDYEPKVPLEEGIPRTVEWNLAWWREHGHLPA